jgi:AraC-like DNA-binding protein
VQPMRVAMMSRCSSSRWMRDPIPVYVHLRRAKDLIDRDFAQPLDVPALAHAAHASRAHFVRSFKKAFGETPHRYLLRRRIERAKELLRNTPLSVTEVSLAVGFRSLGSFSTAFRQLVWGIAKRLCAPLAAGCRAADPGLLHAHVHAPVCEHFSRSRNGRHGLASITVQRRKEERP